MDEEGAQSEEPLLRNNDGDAAGTGVNNVDGPSSWISGQSDFSAGSSGFGFFRSGSALGEGRNNNQGLYQHFTQDIVEEQSLTCLEKLIRKFRKHWNSLRTPNQEEGLDFDTPENKLYLQRLEEISQGTAGFLARNVGALRWVTGLIVALMTAGLAILVDYGVDKLTHLKFGLVNKRLDMNEIMEGCKLFIGLNALLVGIATLFVAFLDVKAKGSGVPEIKSYLNGRKIHRVISVRTLLSKLAGVIFSVSGSLVLGKEGPMMHAGAVAGAIISQGRDEFYSFGVNVLSLRSDKEKRSFVSIGCACGVAAAFSAPLGGVLFVIEEAASYWSVELTWLTFFATMVCASTVDVVISGIKDEAEWGLMSQSAVISFGSFEGASRDPCYPEQPPYRFEEIPIFIAIGIVGGILGAAFNQLNIVLSRFRAKYVIDPRIRMMESLFVSLVTSILIFQSSKMYPCRSKSDIEFALWSGDDPSESGVNQTCGNIQMRGSFCDDSHKVNDLETLMMTSLDSGVRTLFHSEVVFEPAALLIFGTIIFVLGCLTYGTSIPSGLFVPSITIGSAFGRLVGQFLYHYTNGSETGILGAIDPGTYALLGGAAMLGGITRMTISIVVIVMETTNNSTYAIPIMITIMASKVVGDLFTEGLYDMHIELQNIKFIHDQPPPNSHRIKVRHVMVKQPLVFNLFERVSDIIFTLQQCTHNGFPVVSNIAVEVEDNEGGGEAENNHLNKNERTLVSHRSLDTHQAASGARFLLDASGGMGRRISRQRRRDILRQRSRGERSKVLEEDDEDEFRGFGVFEGTVLRSQLLILLYEKVFVDDSIPLHDRMMRKDATIHWRDFFKHYPRSPSLRDVLQRLTPADFDKVIDLRPYIDSSALTVHHSVYISRVHELFRHLGLRHLTIVNSSNQVVGLVTRDQLHDLEHHPTDPHPDAEVLLHESQIAEQAVQTEAQLFSLEEAASLANLNSPNGSDTGPREIFIDTELGGSNSAANEGRDDLNPPSLRDVSSWMRIERQRSRS